MYNDKILKNEEKAVFALRELYKQYGYMPFKMSKFEEYDLYVRNKDFLIGDSVITFNDTNGRLLALKPDVTLSIIKNTTDDTGVKQKVYYDENVYRVSGKTHQFKEIMQTGLECIGDIDISDIFEVVYLAAKSLASVSENFVLDVSHMGVFSALLDEVSDNKLFRKEIAKLISEKNAHEAELLCTKYGIPEDKCEIIKKLITLYGDMRIVISALSKMCTSECAIKALGELDELCTLLEKTEFYKNIRLDFSVVNDMRYYDGILFKGFLAGICEDVLSGGKYDPLMKRMGRKSSAIGFALYLDLLEELSTEKNDHDVDILLIYDEKTSAECVFNAKEKIIASGKSVCAMKNIPKKIRYGEIVYIGEEGCSND